MLYEADSYHSALPLFWVSLCSARPEATLKLLKVEYKTSWVQNSYPRLWLLVIQLINNTTAGINPTVLPFCLLIITQQNDPAGKFVRLHAYHSLMEFIKCINCSCLSPPPPPPTPPHHSLLPCQLDPFTTGLVWHPQSSPLKKVNIDFSSALRSSSLYELISRLEPGSFLLCRQRAELWECTLLQLSPKDTLHYSSVNTHLCCFAVQYKANQCQYISQIRPTLKNKDTLWEWKTQTLNRVWWLLCITLT